jgi:integrase
MGVLPDGRPDRRHRRGKTEAEVTRKVRELEGRREAGSTSRPGRVPTVAQWMRIYLSDIAPLRVDQRTLDSTYRPKVERWIIPRLGKHRLDRLYPEHLYAFYASLRTEGLAPNTIVQIHRILSRALTLAVRQERISRNPCTLIDAPQPEEADTETLTAAEARELLGLTVQRRNGTRWSVALALGLRQSEALGLRRSYVDIDSGVIYVHWQLKRQRYQHGCADPHACGEALHHRPCPPDCPKARRTAGRKHTCSRPCPPECTAHGGKCPQFCPSDCTGHAASCPQRQGGWLFVRPKGGRKRAVPIPPELTQPLREHFASQDAERRGAEDAWQDWDLLWCGPQGQPVDPHDDWEEWKALLAEAGIAKDARLHDARHTAGTLLGEQHVDIHVIQRILGHAQVTTTRIYTEPTDPLTREAAGLIGKALWPDAGKLQPQLQPEAGQ